jgi:hypothetical protein
MDPKTMTLEAIKSLCYDQMVELQRIQNNLNILNAEIAKRADKKEVVESEVVKETHEG